MIVEIKKRQRLGRVYWIVEVGGKEQGGSEDKAEAERLADEWRLATKDWA